MAAYISRSTLRGPVPSSSSQVQRFFSSSASASARRITRPNDGDDEPIVPRAASRQTRNSAPSSAGGGRGGYGEGENIQHPQPRFSVQATDWESHKQVRPSHRETLGRLPPMQINLEGKGKAGDYQPPAGPDAPNATNIYHARRSLRLKIHHGDKRANIGPKSAYYGVQYQAPFTPGTKIQRLEKNGGVHARQLPLAEELSGAQWQTNLVQKLMQNPSIDPQTRRKMISVRLR